MFPSIPRQKPSVTKSHPSTSPQPDPPALGERCHTDAIILLKVATLWRVKETRGTQSNNARGAPPRRGTEMPNRVAEPKLQKNQKKIAQSVVFAPHLATSMTAPLGATLYLAPTPPSPCSTKSAGGGRFVSTTLCQDLPPGGGGSAASTKKSCWLNAT